MIDTALEWVFTHARLLLYQAVVMTTVVIVLIRKREAAAALGWCLAVVFVPVFGAISFYLFGLTRMPRRLKRKLRHHLGFRRKLNGDDRPALHGASDLSENHNLDTVTLMAEKLGAPPPTEGNDVRYFHAGDQAFEAILERVRGAKHHVHVFKYIFRHDGLGRRFLDLLIEKARAGVEIRLIVDAAGSIGSWFLLRELRRAGGRGVVFMPFFAFGKRFMPNLRNHRKLIVVDGVFAFFGGLNVGDEYLGRRSRNRHWCDMHLEVQGPAVADLQRIFAEDWDFSTGEFLSHDVYYPATEARGNSRLQVISAGPDQEFNAIRHVYFAAITEARQRLLIASPYVVPDAAIRDALRSAALLGVDVSLLTQGPPPDHWLAYLAQSFYYDELLRVGVKVYEYTGGMMHAKFLVADDRLACVGTANLDNRSLVLNFELIGILESSQDVREVAHRFGVEVKSARRVQIESFRRRSRWRRLLEGAARLLSPLL